MKLKTNHNLMVTLAVVTFWISACGGVSTTWKQPPGGPVSGTGSGAVASIDEVSRATIQIVAEGAYASPAGSEVLTGMGSGFFVDSSGLAVTNNHVVSGASKVQVYIQGESNPRFARIVALSECSDLAVIDVDGENFQYLDWSSEDSAVGLDVYAAGFPLGDPEFTMTRGIVSKTSSEKVSSISGPLKVLEHDANLQPGNSGGPLVNGSGQVVGVNYFGFTPSSGTTQFFAIASEEAIPLIEQLKDGVNVNTIGINGNPIDLGPDKIGIWVSAVMSGYPADTAGVKPGDVVLTLEDTPVAPDQTMAPYCGILRSHEITDPLRIKVYRPSTQQILEGQLNGTPLTPVASLAPEPPSDGASGTSTPGTGGPGNTPSAPTSPTTPSDPSASASYVTITDNSKTLSIQVPVSWTDVVGGPWKLNGVEVGPAITASPKIDQFASTWTTPGLFFAASRSLAQTYKETTPLDDPNMGLNFNGQCTYKERQDYNTAAYVGKADIWRSCGGEDTGMIIIAVMPQDKSYLMILLLQITKGVPVQDAEAILNSFQVIGGL